MTPMEILLSHCALDALVDSKERYDPPRCAPETRDAIQQQIVEWILQLTLSGLVMWLTGSAGAGKSAVAQTIAERFNRLGTPSTSFFFSRISSSATRVDGDRLLPTIIYQLCLLFPEYKTSVLKQIKRDPAIFRRAREAQMAALITKPLQRFSFRRWFRELRGGCPQTLLIIIDGLDECRDPQVQCDLLRIIANAAASSRHRPLRFLIASRPEAHIARMFNHHPSFTEVGLRCIDLDEDYDASMAILAFLRQEFSKIHEHHPLRFHLDPSWPNQDTLSLIVSKSSPQFILASTAMSYVASPRHLPTLRLNAIMDILKAIPTTSQKDQPLEKLDLLYTMIFNDIEEEHRFLVQSLLGIIHLSSVKEYSLPPPTSQRLEMLLNLQNGEVCLRLEPLSSILHTPEPHLGLPIRSLHASLFDYLLNPLRSHGLMINLNYARAGLIGHCLLLGQYIRYSNIQVCSKSFY